MVNLQGILQYNEESPSGLSWATDRPNGGPRAGDFAGCLSSSGYWFVWVSGKTYLAHRVIMQLLGKSISANDMVDHVNRDKSDNRIGNLRVVTNQQNQFNRGTPANSTTGCKGVSVTRDKWRAVIVVGGRKISLGNYPTIFEAACARKSAELIYHII